MQQTEVHREGLMPDSTVTKEVAVARLAIGLVQGLLLYFYIMRLRAIPGPRRRDIYLHRCCWRVCWHP
jgi:hypothetical protein